MGSEHEQRKRIREEIEELRRLYLEQLKRVEESIQRSESLRSEIERHLNSRRPPGAT